MFKRNKKEPDKPEISPEVVSQFLKNALESLGLGAEVINVNDPGSAEPPDHVKRAFRRAGGGGKHWATPEQIEREKNIVRDSKTPCPNCGEAHDPINISPIRRWQSNRQNAIWTFVIAMSMIDAEAPIHEPRELCVQLRYALEVLGVTEAEFNEIAELHNMTVRAHTCNDDWSLSELEGP